MGRRRLGAVLAVAALVVTAAGCNWGHPRYGPGRAGHNPFEDRITVGNVDELAELWTAELPHYAYEVIVTGGLVVTATAGFPGGDAYVTALDPASGEERWTVTVPGGGCGPPGCFGARAAIASAEGLVFVANEAGPTGGLFALDTATGATVRTYASGPSRTPVVADGRLYAQIVEPAGAVVAAWDVATAAPLFRTAPIAGSSVLSVGAGKVFDARSGMKAHDAAGVEGCTGMPVVCEPLWSNPGSGVPALDGDVAAVGTRVWSAAGCGSPSCPPLWEGDAAGSSEAALADGFLYVTRGGGGGLAAFAAAGCGAPVCDPVWTGPGASQFSTITVAGDVVYVASGDEVSMYAAAGCGGAECPTLAALRFPAPVAFNTVPVVDGGRLFVALDDATLVALAPPEQGT